MPNKVSTELILSSIALLIGILLISFGHYDNDKVLLYIGLSIVLASVVMGVLFLLILRKT
jgi:hypothetical protein